VSTTPRPTSAPVSTHTDDELLTLQEVSDLVRVPVATLRYWRHLGSGPSSFRIGRSVRYWRTEVFLWLDGQSAAAHAACQDTAGAVGRTPNG
jgi:predicted DNA-binding transcriptional regulator AlpA